LSPRGLRWASRVAEGSGFILAGQQAGRDDAAVLSEIEVRCRQAFCSDAAWHKGYYALAQELLEILDRDGLVTLP
jgi:hypothetical protein